jgi:hypothetical protein
VIVSPKKPTEEVAGRRCLGPDAFCKLQYGPQLDKKTGWKPILHCFP